MYLGIACSTRCASRCFYEMHMHLFFVYGLWMLAPICLFFSIALSSPCAIGSQTKRNCICLWPELQTCNLVPNFFSCWLLLLSRQWKLFWYLLSGFFLGSNCKFWRWWHFEFILWNFYLASVVLFLSGMQGPYICMTVRWLQLCFLILLTREATGPLESAMNRYTSFCLFVLCYLCLCVSIYFLALIW